MNEVKRILCAFIASAMFASGITALIYLFAAFVGWGFWPTHYDDRDAALMALRAVFAFQMLIYVPVILGTKEEST